MLSNLRFAKELNDLQSAMRKGYRDVAEAIRITRMLGVSGLCEQDIPLDWPRGDRQHLIWRAGLFANVPEDIFEDWIKQASRHTNAFSVNSIRSKAIRYRAEQARLSRQRAILSAHGVNIYKGDITKLRKLQCGKVQAIVTDPPYQKTDLPLWRELAEFSDAVLDDHGWLLAMSGQRWLPEVFASIGLLRYCWTIAMHMPGASQSQAWLGRNNSFNIEWKPILVYSKNDPSNWPDCRDFIVSPGRDKNHHSWGQNEDVFRFIVEKFTSPGDSIADPFLGGGTTAAASFALGRAFEGFDIDEANVNVSKVRLMDMADKSKQGGLL